MEMSDSLVVAVLSKGDVMRTVYRVLAYVVAAEVVVQAMAMVFAIAGLGKWVDGGGVLDKAVMESDESPFPEVIGFAVHGINGMMIVPAIALLLLVSSFFAKVSGAVKWAAVVLLLVVVQVTLGLAGTPSLPSAHCTASTRCCCSARQSIPHVVVVAWP